MAYELTTDAYFDSAHFLEDYHGKCENLHGHRWKVTVGVAAEKLIEAGDEAGMVCDFADFKRIVIETVAAYDHTFLVRKGTLLPETIRCLEAEGFSLKMLDFRTTAENLAKNFFDEFKAKGLSVSFVEVSETPNNRARYQG